MTTDPRKRSPAGTRTFGPKPRVPPAHWCVFYVMQTMGTMLMGVRTRVETRKVSRAA